MKIKIILQSALAIGTCFASSVSMAQSGTTDQPQYMNRGGATSSTWQSSLVRDGVYDKIPHLSKPLEWQPVREADILWKKRVWREIDTRQKQNLAFRYPGDDETGGGTFIEILVDAVNKGKVKAYQPYDEDRFQNALDEAAINSMLVGKPDTNYIIDPITEETTMKITNRDFDPDVVTMYRVKEDVIFDRNLGRMVTRIIGIAPIKDVIKDGQYRGQTPLFWIYYPELRETLAQYEVFNPENDVQRLNWDEFFESRRFASNIIKVSNATDSRFEDLGMSKIEALWESQRVQEELFNKEHDLWVY